MAQIPLQTSGSEAGKLYEGLSGSCNNFASTFQKELLATGNGNIVSSPLSVHMILSLLSHGAEDKTLNEFTTNLYHHDESSLKEEYKSLITVLNDVKNVKLYIANALYIQDGFQLLKEFSSIGTNIYQSLISSLDFEKKIDAADKINTWVKGVTDKKISDLVSSDDFNERTKLVLVNAIYFKGHWLRKFVIENTQNRIFHVSKTETKLVPTMFQKAMFDHGEIPSLHARFIEIPYMNEDIIMIILLPNEVDGLQSLQTNFDKKALDNAVRSKDKLELYLPKFQFEFSVNLESILRKIGLNTIFEDNADFSRISSNPLKVSKVVHKAVIEVNEEGTEAAAATAVQMRLKRMMEMPEEFMVDRPFMFIIQHKPSSISLFVGAVKDLKSPQKDEL